MTTTDRLDIADLFARLSSLLDENRYKDLHEIYTEDAVVHSPRGGELSGIEAIAKYLQQSHVDTEQTQHINANILITLTTDNEAQASANQLVYRHHSGKPPHETSGLRVSYTAVRTPTGWRFRKAQITPAWTDQRSDTPA